MSWKDTVMSGTDVIMKVCYQSCPDTTRGDFECEECRQQIEKAIKAQAEISFEAGSGGLYT